MALGACGDDDIEDNGDDATSTNGTTTTGIDTSTGSGASSGSSTSVAGTSTATSTSATTSGSTSFGGVTESSSGEEASSDADASTAGSDEETGSDSTGGGATQPVDIRFVGMFGEQAAACDTTYEGVGVGAHAVELIDARLYVSNLRLVDAQGVEVPVVLDDDDEWQNGSTALLDFEDASGSCSVANTVATNDRVVGTIPEGTYQALVFDVGVPENDNHIDSTLADPPLNESAMFWNWRNGFKFVRVDLDVALGDSSVAWNFHLGSTGAPCTEAGGPAEQPPSGACARPSRPSIDLPFDLESDVVVVDLGALFAGVDLGMPPEPAEMNPSGCQSGDFQAVDDACRAPFAALGLDVDTGMCDADCEQQSVFSTMRQQ